MAIDPESEQFIQWSTKLLSDQEIYRDFLLECRRKFQNFISRDPDEIRRRLGDKLMLGAIEHGAPSYDLPTVDKELEMEFLDIIGWSLVRMWNERKTQKETGT